MRQNGVKENFYEESNTFGTIEILEETDDRQFSAFQNEPIFAIKGFIDKSTKMLQKRSCLPQG